MTDFQVGFLTKCAEAGVPYKLARAMLKKAEGTFVLDGSVGHTMADGETISGVAAANGYPQSALQMILADNGLTEATARKIKPGTDIYFRPSPEDYVQERKPAPAAAASTKAPAAAASTNAPAATATSAPPAWALEKARDGLSPEERERRVEEMRAENRRRNPKFPENYLGVFYRPEAYNASTNTATAGN